MILLCLATLKDDTEESQLFTENGIQYQIWVCVQVFFFSQKLKHINIQNKQTVYSAKVLQLQYIYLTLIACLEILLQLIL